MRYTPSGIIRLTPVRLWARSKLYFVVDPIRCDTIHLDFYRTVAKRLKEQFIWKVLSEIKHDDPTEIGDPVAYFIIQMHRAVSAEGVEL
jgi:hypothetical protein